MKILQQKQPTASIVVPTSHPYIFQITVFLELIYKQCLTNDCLLIVIGTATLQGIQLTRLMNCLSTIKNIDPIIPNNYHSVFQKFPSKFE
jgi:hypothetical protein